MAGVFTIFFYPSLDGMFFQPITSSGSAVTDTLQPSARGTEAEWMLWPTNLVDKSFFDGGVFGPFFISVFQTILILVYGWALLSQNIATRHENPAKTRPPAQLLVDQFSCI